MYKIVTECAALFKDDELTGGGWHTRKTERLDLILDQTGFGAAKSARLWNSRPAHSVRREDPAEDPAPDGVSCHTAVSWAVSHRGAVRHRRRKFPSVALMPIVSSTGHGVFGCSDQSVTFFSLAIGFLDAATK